MNIDILTEDFENAKGFHNTEHCPLAVAVKRTIPGAKAKVYMTHIQIDGSDYDFKGWTEDFRTDCYYSTWVNEMIQRAKGGNDITPFQVDIINYNI